MSAGSIPKSVLEVAELARQREEAELARAAAKEALKVYPQRATGAGDIDETFSLPVAFRLVYVRCHFSGGAGTADLVVYLDSGAGSKYDAQLVNLRTAGTGSDINHRLPVYDRDLPSPWTLQPGDASRLAWTNPDPGKMTWGLEVGLALA